MKLSFIAGLLASPTAPALIKAVKMCPRKDIEGVVGHVSIKPTVVAADLSGSAQGEARPYPYRTDWQRHEWHPSL